MALTKYAALLQSLLPEGKAWPREEGANLTKLVEGCAVEFARVDDRALELVDEMDPRTVSEMLAEMEADHGIVDAGTLSEAERQARLTALELGGDIPTAAFFVALAASLGYVATVTEYPLSSFFDCGSDCIDPVLGWNMVSSWILTAPTGGADTVLAAAVARFAPLHTVCRVDFT